MTITVKSLGDLIPQENGFVKFVLFADGTLLFGKVHFHKDLLDAATITIDEKNPIIAAGVVPEHIKDITITDNVWGDWQSSGYGVTTPDEYKAAIHEALKPYEAEINKLWDII